MEGQSCPLLNESVLSWVSDNYSLANVFVLSVLEYNAWYFAWKQVHWK